MRFQQPALCSDNVVDNFAASYGRRISRRTINKLTGSTYEEGGDEKRVTAGLRGIGAHAVSHLTTKRSAAWMWLHGAILAGRRVILAVDKDQHWVLAFARAGDRIVVFDGTNTKANHRICGVHCLTKESLLRRWRCKAGYFGITAWM